MDHSMPPASSLGGYEADERLAARHATTLAEESWRSLCTANASTFVAAERRTVQIQRSLKDLLSKIEAETKPSTRRVSKALDPKYQPGDDEDEAEEGEEIKPATELLADLAEKHRLRRRTLMQHSSLLELLELPSLMDACVRSSLYEDALSIAGFANTLERRHLMERSEEKQSAEDEERGKRGDVVAGVVSEIRRREADLRRMLINRLRGDVTMPQCLEVVTALRRLNGVELERRNNSTNKSGDDLEGVHAAMEMRLQVDFLEARDAWLESGIAKIGSAAAAVAATSSSADKGGASAQSEQILDGIERYRTRCFEIVTQFLAIFRGSLAPSASDDSQDHSFSLLSMWTARRVQTFLTSLSSNMSLYVHDTATLRDSLDSASFFASSMGRVGADFQPLLAPIFEPRLTEMIVGHWAEGLSGMVEILKACRDAGIAGPLVGAETSTTAPPNGGSTDGPEMTQSSRTPAPPRKLLAYPPLARFLNSYLEGLNELRRCLLPGAFPAIRAAQAELVADAKLALQSNERAVLTPGLRGESAKLREVASRMKTEMEELATYMNSCLEVSLGSVDYALAEAKKAREIEEAKAEARRERLAKEAAADEAARLEKERQEKEKAAEAAAAAEAERQRQEEETRSVEEKRLAADFATDAQSTPVESAPMTGESTVDFGQVGDNDFDDWNEDGDDGLYDD